MIVYICGPITGKPNGNIEAFDFAQEQLLRMGHHPINPHHVCREIVAMHEGSPRELWVKCMKRDIPELMKADAILMLKDWQYSEGAKLERHIAAELGIAVMWENELFAPRPTRAPEPPSNKAPDSKL